VSKVHHITARFPNREHEIILPTGKIGDKISEGWSAILPTWI
jgi:hypothetical protein